MTLTLLALIAFFLYARHASRCIDRAYQQGFNDGLETANRIKHQEWCHQERAYAERQH